MTDLKELSLAELNRLAKDIDKAIAAAEARRRKDARNAMDKVAKEFGVSIEEVLAGDGAKSTRKKPGPKPKKAKAKKGAPKFRNPEAPEQTWTGKGRRPAWFIAAIEAGKSEDDLAI